MGSLAPNFVSSVELKADAAAASAVGETGIFFGGGYTAYRLLNFVPSLQ